MTLLKIVTLLVLISSPGMAQRLCTSPPPVGDPCLVGHWVGNNTARERIIGALQRTAPASVLREIESSLAPVLGMSIYDDGFYHTLPIHHRTIIKDTPTEIRDPETTMVLMDLSITTQTGFINGDGGLIEFCDAGGGGAVLQFSAQSPSGGGSETVNVNEGERFEPVIIYTCAADILTMQVGLPDPIGAVDYTLFRVSADLFDSDVELMREAAREGLTE